MEPIKKELEFAEGISFFKPRENAPKSIKGNIVIDKDKFSSFFAKQEGSVIRIDLRKSETKGTYYFTVNNWKPTPKDDSNVPPDAL